jgi:hypothetical protein
MPWKEPRLPNQGLVFRPATSADEYEQIHRLNYATFVEEIPQHHPNEQRRLVDAMIGRSDCFVCLDGERLIGMFAVCGDRPFSLDGKLDDLDQYLPAGQRPCEVRLLAVERVYRSGRVFIGLMRQLLGYCDENGYDMAVFSAAESQWHMYLSGGCVAFGPLLGTEEARFRGMYITRDHFSDGVRHLLRQRRSALRSDQ